MDSTGVVFRHIFSDSAYDHEAKDVGGIVFSVREQGYTLLGRKEEEMGRHVEMGEGRRGGMQP